MAMDPWGPIDWLIGKDKALSTNLLCLGTLSFEERSTFVPRLAGSNGGASVLLRIDDPPSRYSDAITDAIHANREELLGAVQFTEVPAALLATDQQIADKFANAVATASSQPVTLWLDISSMPKRYFFLILKLALRSAQVNTLVVTYTQPAPGGYGEIHLSEDPDDLRPLPGYASLDKEPSTLVVAVGFESLGLPQFLSEYRDKRRNIVVFIPFPPGQPYAQRIWRTVQRLGLKTFGLDSRRVAALDAFETLMQLEAVQTAEAARGTHPEGVSLALAPYGPKPISLGMCLFAIKHDSPVFYTQPKSYNPDYTRGVGASWAYLVKFGGESL